ncbi:TetR/AcrR family transcriptional regulator [Kribbella sp. CA-294648]|uniref:TetR/AcrR family transcriptional regulator n=1 Tax=Kribbella sp. CA-294648 TaxID=3239948 RepID=UPI003D91EAF8
MKRDASSHAAAGISVGAIVAAALGVIRESGVEGLTMRSVAERLEVRAPTLYHHVRNKGELLELVARNAFDSFEADRAAFEKVETVGEWVEVTTAGALRLREFYAGHPGLARLIQAKATPYRDEGEGSRAALVRAQLTALVRLGIPEPVARSVFETTARWTMAAVAAEPAAAERPAVRGAAAVRPATDAGGEDLFADGLSYFLRGVQAHLEDVLSAG